MVCKSCEKIEDNYRENPFKGASEDIYKCPDCGQNWWRYNDYFHLWSKIDDNATLENVKGGCKKPVVIGNVSTNLSNLVEGGDEFR